MKPNINNNIYDNENDDNNNNINSFICQEQDMEECESCNYLDDCIFWNDDYKKDTNNYKHYWYEMSYHRFIQKNIDFKHSELK